MIEIKENKKGTGVKKDCFAYKTTYEGEKCIALTELFCQKKIASFISQRKSKVAPVQQKRKPANPKQPGFLLLYIEQMYCSIMYSIWQWEEISLWQQA